MGPAEGAGVSRTIRASSRESLLPRYFNKFQGSETCQTENECRLAIRNFPTGLNLDCIRCRRNAELLPTTVRPAIRGSLRRCVNEEKAV